MRARIGAHLGAHWPLWLALAVGLALRIALWGRLPRLGLISDEAEYLAAADWLANGRGFAWHTQYLWTRAPLYPLFVAGHFALFGRAVEPVFVTQMALSLVNVPLTYALALRLGGVRAAAGVAALLAALYLPLASYAQILLSETLFVTLLLGAVVCLGCWTTHNGASTQHAARTMQVARDVLLLGGAGVLLGLATLTRGLTLAFFPVVAAWVLVAAGGRSGSSGWLGRGAALCVLAVAYGATVAPWSLYASRAYGGPIAVDTTGAFNLALGARTAYDGGRSDEPTRNFVLALLLPDLSLEQRQGLLAERRGADGTVTRAAACLYGAGDQRLAAALAAAPRLTQADRQSLLTAEALCLLRARPLAFVAKSLSELVDLFTINYTGDERLSKGFALGRLPPWYVAALFLLDDTLYVLALPLAVLGWALLRTRAAGAPGSGLVLGLVGLWLLYNLAAAPLLFAINRFRVPLMPFAFALAGAAIAAGVPALRAALRTGYGAACGALASLLLLVAASPYAFFEPRAPGEASRWASYLGPYPSSAASSLLALASRPGYLREQELGAALGAGDRVAARAALLEPELPAYAAAVGAPLLDGLEGRPAEGLDRLATQQERPLEDWQTAVVAGELFRQLGDLDAARRELGPTLVDNQNPVAWAWAWLYPPPPDARIELADDNDLGYIDGFYLGRYDADLGATTRWATGEAALRFPGGGSGAPRQLCLRASALGWPGDLAPPVVEVVVDGAPVGSFAPGRGLGEHCFTLPARPLGTNLLVSLRSPTFVPDALDLIAQQGPQVGQLRTLAFQLDAAELR